MGDTSERVGNKIKSLPRLFHSVCVRVRESLVKMFEAKTYLQSLKRTQKREVDLTENVKQHETFKRLVEHSTRVSRGDWLFRKQNVDEKIREEIRMEETLRKKEEREKKDAMMMREEESVE